MITFDEIFGDGGKSKELDSLLLEIQEKHSEWFSENLGTHKNGDPKKLTDVRTLYYPGNGLVTFNILIELPDYIKNECDDAFRKVYGNTLPE